ncbi:MAG: hypothetical protein FWD69_10090 [Polyangiaceae bacterium]|nr:hypothetical protein [Polyangiaceae bacterium]
MIDHEVLKWLVPASITAIGAVGWSIYRLGQLTNTIDGLVKAVDKIRKDLDNIIFDRRNNNAE